MTYTVRCRSTDPEWQALRREGIGASEAAAIMGVSPWRSPLQLWAEKTGAIEPPELEGEWIEWGHRLEPAILEAYRDRTGRHTEPSREMLWSDEHRWAFATLDGWTTDTHPHRWPLEVKNVSGWKADEWEDGPPAHYVTQLEHQMLVSGADRATIVALLGGQRLVWCDVMRDEQRIRKLAHHCAKFWESVEQGTMPPPGPADRQVLGQMHSEPEDDAVVPLDGEFYELDARRCELTVEIAKLSDQRDIIDNRIRAAIGNATRGVLPDGTEYRWAKTKRGRRLTRHAPKN